MILQGMSAGPARGSAGYFDGETLPEELCRLLQEATRRLRCERLKQVRQREVARDVIANETSCSHDASPLSLKLQSCRIPSHSLSLPLSAPLPLHVTCRMKFQHDLSVRCTDGCVISNSKLHGLGTLFQVDAPKVGHD